MTDKEKRRVLSLHMFTDMHDRMTTVVEDYGESRMAAALTRKEGERNRVKAEFMRLYRLIQQMMRLDCPDGMTTLVQALFTLNQLFVERYQPLPSRTPRLPGWFRCGSRPSFRHLYEREMLPCFIELLHVIGVLCSADQVKAQMILAYFTDQQCEQFRYFVWDDPKSLSHFQQVENAIGSYSVLPIVLSWYQPI